MKTRYRDASTNALAAPRAKRFILTSPCGLLVRRSGPVTAALPVRSLIHHSCQVQGGAGSAPAPWTPPCPSAGSWECRLRRCLSCATLMRFMGKRVASLEDQRVRLARGERAASLDPPLQVLPLEELHHQKRHARLRVDPRIGGLDDVLAVNLGRDGRLDREPLAQHRIPDELGAHHLERAAPPGPEVRDLVDHPHPPDAEAARDLVAAMEHRSDGQNHDVRCILHRLARSGARLSGGPAPESRPKRAPSQAFEARAAAFLFISQTGASAAAEDFMSRTGPGHEIV